VVFRGGSRGTSNSCVGEQSSNYQRQSELKAIFILLRRCSTYLKSTFGFAFRNGY